jgi:hypothetical protein
MIGHARVSRVDQQLRHRDFACASQARHGADAIALTEKMKDASAGFGIELAYARSYSALCLHGHA